MPLAADRRLKAQRIEPANDARDMGVHALQLDPVKATRPCLSATPQPLPGAEPLAVRHKLLWHAKTPTSEKDPKPSSPSSLSRNLQFAGASSEKQKSAVDLRETKAGPNELLPPGQAELQIGAFNKEAYA